MKILVTGAAGFIGFHTVRRLLERGDEVVGLDNINDYYDVNLKYGRLTETGINRESVDWYKFTQSDRYPHYRFIRMNLEDMQAMRIDLLLGPGMNIQRDPMCGRNFEYFSEDPLISGKMASAMVRGLQSLPGGGGCIKHYAANNQETNRNAVDSVIGQRALREIYLEPYKIAIQESQPLSIMSSYNLINGVPTADSYDLCTDLARGEWGFKGLIMTDWNGGSSTPWKSMHAGNDLIMPGGKGRAMNILQAVRTVMPEFDERGQVIMVQEVPFAPVFAARWNSFTVDPEGPDTVMAPLGEGHTAEMKDGEILVDGEKVYMQANDMKTFFNDPASFVPKICPANGEVAFILDDGRAIGYKGHLDKKPRLCLGDVQRCAVHNLRIILKCMGL